MQKYGFDIHGVIDKKPRLYSKLTKRLIENEHEVHIITGVQINDRVLNKLKELNISYTHLFSITNYHESIGTEITYTDPDHPHMDNEIWDKTKAEYCEQHGIDLHVDDSEDYGKYFKDTVYVLVTE